MHMNKAMIVYVFAAQILMSSPALSCISLFHIGTWNNKQLIMIELVADFQFATSSGWRNIAQHLLHLMPLHTVAPQVHLIVKYITAPETNI